MGVPPKMEDKLEQRGGISGHSLQNKDEYKAGGVLFQFNRPLFTGVAMVDIDVV